VSHEGAWLCRVEGANCPDGRRGEALKVMIRQAGRGTRAAAEGGLGVGCCRGMAGAGL